MKVSMKLEPDFDNAHKPQGELRYYIEVDGKILVANLTKEEAKALFDMLNADALSEEMQNLRLALVKAILSKHEVERHQRESLARIAGTETFKYEAATVVNNHWRLLLNLMAASIAGVRYEE